MQKIKITNGTTLTAAYDKPRLISIEGGFCRLYMGAVPTDTSAGHYVGDGYQIVVPQNMNVYATADNGREVFAIVGDFSA